MTKPVETEQVTAEYRVLNHDTLGEITGILTPPGYTVKQPIGFRMRHRANKWVLSTSITGVYGFGYSRREAVNELAEELVGQYRDLENKPIEELAHLAQRRAKWLRARLEFTPPQPVT